MVSVTQKLFPATHPTVHHQGGGQALCPEKFFVKFFVKKCFISFLFQKENFSWKNFFDFPFCCKDFFIFLKFVFFTVYSYFWLNC